MAEDGSKGGAAQALGLDGLRDALRDYLEAQAEHLAKGAGKKVTELTKSLTDVSENGGSLAGIGSKLMKGESPVKALVSQKAKDAKDNIVGSVKKLGGGGGGGKPDDVKATNIVESVEIGVPLRTVYDHWTQLEEFNSFTKGVQKVEVSEDTASEWTIKVCFSTRSWSATIEEQVPDERIVWNSEGNRGTTRGAVSFHALTPTLTKVVVVVEYSPAGFVEKTANLWRAAGRRLRLDLKHFQRHVTLGADEELEGWRGEIRDGEVVRSHEDAVSEEEGEQSGDGEGGEDWDDEDVDRDEDRDEGAEDEGADDEEDRDEADDDEEDEDDVDEEGEADDEDEETRPRRGRGGSRRR